VKVDGTGRLTKRNRKFLRHFTRGLLDVPLKSAQHASLPRSVQSDAQSQMHSSPPQLSAPSQPDGSRTIHPSSLQPRPDGSTMHSDDVSTRALTTNSTAMPTQVDIPAGVSTRQESLRSDESSCQPTRNDCSHREGTPRRELTPVTQQKEPDSPLRSRPQRFTRPPAKYEPETGRWV